MTSIPEAEEAPEDGYNSASDDDFDPTARLAEDEQADSSSSADENEDQNSSGRKRKGTAEDLDFDNSGDEATITKAKKKKRKTTSAEDHSDEEGGEGGLVKTRAQRKAEVLEKKPVVQASKASVDVNALWAQMSGPKDPLSNQKSNSFGAPALEERSKPTNSTTDEVTKTKNSTSESNEQKSSSPSHSNNQSTVTIKRTYDFAGQTMHEERVVSASSAEAKLYLEEQARKSNPIASSTTGKPPLRRPKKRASIFDDPTVMTAASNGPKLNTLQKSKLDWAAHVDQEGISEELDEHRRAKEGYLGRMDFLGRMDSKREEDLRSIRSK